MNANAARACLAGFFLALGAASVLRAEIKPLVVEGAPFPLTVQEWTPPARDFPITAYGAKPDGTAVTEAIEAAIDAAEKVGGGRVVVPKGEWISGAFKLKSNVALIVSKDAILHFPDDPVLVMRAPLRPDGRPTMTHGALIGATACTNVAIMGEGTIKSDVTYWHDNFMKNPKRGWGRPQAINFKDCKNVRLEGFKVRGSPAWTMHLKVCEDIVMRGVDSVCTGPNTDGLDLESCNRALVENCSLDQTDDTYTIKSGFNAAGRKRNIPTQNVVIRNCRAVHGHTLLGVGSEVSGGIRNIYMTDCTVEAECWRFLFVKTNCKRGAFVENVWMENIRGVSAPSAVFETEMYYDGNPNKELTKKGGPTWPTRISNIHVKNVTCASAGYAVKVRGDPELPPKGIYAENIRIGKLRYDPVKASNAPELEIKNVREDPSALREILDVPPQVRLMDPARDADPEVGFVRDRLEELSFNEINRRICEGRIAAETARGRNVAPRVTPLETPTGDVTFSGIYSRRIGDLLQDFSCAVSNAWIADDVRQVARAGADGRTRGHPGVTFALKPDLATGDLTVTIVNGGKTPLTDLWCVVHLPPERMTRRHTFRAAKVPPGGKFERTFSMGAGAHYLPRPVGPSLYAAEVDFTRDGTRSRVWTTAEAQSGIWHPNLNATALHAGPLDAPEADDETLCRLSTETGALPPLGDHPRTAWKSPAFPGAAWYNVSPASRPYTPEEKRLIYAGRAYEVVALQFDVPTNTTTILRNTACLWTRKAMLFLNGERIPLTGKTSNLPVKVGLNRLLVKYPCRPGEATACLQLSVYPWDASTCWPCVPFPKAAPQAVQTAAGPQEFPLEWNVRHAAGRPYEVEISTEKLARLAGVKKGTGFAVRAETPQGAKDLAVATLPGKVAGTVDLRFTVPEGTTALTCCPTGALKMSNPQETDNLFAGILSDAKRWTLSPRMIAEPQADGCLLFRPRSGGSPEATCTIDVPPGLAGQPVKFEAILESLGGASWTLRLNIQQLDAKGERLPEPVYDRRWTTLMMPPGGKRCPFAELGRIHPEARKLRLFFSMSTGEKKYDEHGLVRAHPAEALTKVKFSRLALRPAEQLPFPKYDDTYFAAGVSGQAGDCAIRLGGVDERAFWYQTRSMASWNENIQLRKEEQLFFPAGAGTVEAWFKSDWQPVRYRSGDKELCRPIALFQCYQSYRAHECKGGKGAMLLVAYRPDPGELEFSIKDRFGTSYTGTKATKLPKDQWCHLAVQWAPGGTAEVFVDGRKKLSVPIPNWKALDLADPEIKVPNDENGLELYLGSTWQSARAEVKTDPAWPLYQGAADLLRVSTGCRYKGDFTPARALTCDADTRALFSFDRVFDGTSGGGPGWIPGTTRALSNGRVARQLEIGGRKVQYTPKHVPAELDPRIVFDVVNFPVLPTAADFETARRPFTKSAVLKNGETLSLDCPEKVVTDFVEIANVSDRPLSYPIVLNTGDVDPRSCGDLADTLALDGLDDRARVDRVFSFVLASTDYFMNHTAMFPPGSDTPRDVEYHAMLMLNGYCGFECGPLNNLTANLFVNVARCPASLTAGYGHSFEQVFYDGKNHIYDLSAQKYFPAMDNETAAYLEEGDNECGIFPRMGNPAEHFMRKSTRGIWVGNASCDEKIGVTLNPGEAFRVWQVNDGHCNDLMARTKLGVYKGHASKFRPDYTEPCHADTEKIFLQRTERFFPQYLNGFITFDGAPSADNPAFGCATNGTFCYKVASGGYPIVHAEYAATRRDGSRAELELSTDGGKTFRPFVSPADYAVRARYAYLVRVKAPIGDIARFAAATEVQLNPRVYPGRLKAGANTLTFKCVSDGTARVTVQGRVPAGRIAVPAAVSSGAIVGAETLFYAFDPAESPVLDVEGVSPNATVKTFGGLRATLKGGKLALSADKVGGVRMTAVRIIDNGAEKTMAVLVGTGVRFGTARQAKVSNRAKMLPPDAASPQARGWLPANNHEAEIAFPIAAVPAGKYAVLCLNRFESHPEEDPDNQVRMLWGDMKSTNLGRARNWGCNYKKANFGRPGERAQFKWDYAFHPGTGYPYAVIRVAELPAAERVAFRSWRNHDAVEIAAVLVVPDPSMDLRGELTRVLCGLNCDPWRVSAR